MRRAGRRLPGILAGILLLVSTVLFAGEAPIYLKAPGLRLEKDPAIVIPADYFYTNRHLPLPHYRDAAGNPADGWLRKYVATRRFQSDQSAWIYYRPQDLKHAVTFSSSGDPGGGCVWPGNSLIVIESYLGVATDQQAQVPMDIAVISKAGRNTVPYGKVFLPAEWSYARFTSRGEPSMASDTVQDCHQCHAIAFRLTGDLVFTRFP